MNSVVQVSLAVLVILVATTACGRVSQRIGLSRVVGEMIAGVVLGPSLLGWIAPSMMGWLFPADVKNVLYVLGTFGLTFYMFLVGTNIDHGQIRDSVLWRAGVLAAGGIIPTFLLGGVFALVAYERLAPPGTSTLGFFLFVGGAVSMTAFPMLARILHERGIARTRFGSLVLVAAAADDAVAWLLLAVIVAIAETGSPVSALPTLLGCVAFVILALTAGRRILHRVAVSVESAGRMSTDSFAVVLLVVVAAGCFTEYIGMFGAFGGFVMGLALPSSPKLRESIRHRMSDFNEVFLLPVFFAYSGLNTDMRELGNIGNLAFAGIVLLIAFLGKYVGCGLAARMVGLSWRGSSALASLMNGRGLMILIFTNIGLAHGIVSPPLFAILVLVAVVTSAVATPAYRLSMPSWLERREVFGRTDHAARRGVDPAAVRTDSPAVALVASRGEDQTPGSGPPGLPPRDRKPLMTRINPTDEIVTLVNTFTVEPQRQSELTDILEKVARDVMSKFPGFISANLHTSLDGTRVLNYAQWRDQDSLRQAIRHSDFLPHYQACNEISSAEPMLYRVSSVEESAQDVDFDAPIPFIDEAGKEIRNA